MAIKVTAGNVDDRSPLKAMLKDITGKVFGDKGYISKPLFQELWHKGIQLITGIRKNMKDFWMIIRLSWFFKFGLFFWLRFWI